MREAGRAGRRDPDAIELSVSGYLPTTTEEEVAAAEAAGIRRMLLSTSMSRDLDGLAAEVDAFAARFGPLSPPGPARTPTTSATALATGYAAAVDALDGPAFADLFTPDGELWVPDPRVGGEPTICRAGRDRLARIPSGLARYHATRHAVWADHLRRRRRAGHRRGRRGWPTTWPPATRGGGRDGHRDRHVWYLALRGRLPAGPAAGWRIARRSLHLPRHRGPAVAPPRARPGLTGGRRPTGSAPRAPTLRP